MTAADNNRTVALYRQALALPADQRAAFVAEQAAGDTALRAAVLALLSGQPATAVGQPSGNGADALAPGTRIGHYRIDGVLGAGGMGVVYRATDERLNRPVAVKFLAAELLDAAATARFKREAQMASALNHPHILTVYDVGEHEGRQFLVTELVDGGTLADWAATNPARRDWRRTIEMLAGVGDGLAAAHAAGILHRDVKPANVLVSRSGHAKLGDFGLAKPASDGVGATAAGIAVGTVAYMSPEQASGQRLDARSDIFSFGVLLYELLEGHGPFPGRSDLEVLQSILHGAPRPVRDDLPDALRGVIEKLLEKDPAERYQTMSDVVVDLRRALRKSSGEIRPSGQATPPPAAASTPARGPINWGAIVAIAAVVAGAFVATRGPLAPRPDTAAIPQPSPQAATAAVIASAPVAADPMPRIAVLPFENLSPDPDNAFFTDGLHQEILTTLNRSPDLAVIPRTTMMLYRAAPKSVREIAAELSAAYVLEGSVRREGDAVRLTVQLIDARDDRQLWSEAYNETLTSALTLQAEVAQQVAERLSVRLGIGQQRIAAANPAANDLYLKARLARQNLNGSFPIESWLAVETLLDQAIASDPSFARAYVARSKLHRDMGISGYGSREERLALARSDLEAAQRLAPNDPETLGAEAMFTARSDPARALALFEAAERAGLRDPELLFAKASVLHQMGRAREGVELQRQLSALDPGNPNLSSVLWFNLTVMREPVAALQTLALAEERFPAFGWQQLRARTVYSFTGNLEPLAPYTDPRLVAEAPARNQAQDDALRNIAERIAFRGQYGEARDLLDSYARIELFGNNVVTYYAVEGSAPQPTAEMRGWLSLILDDAAEAALDGRRVLAFLDRTAETPANAWYRRYLRAAARLFLGEHDAAVADARAMLELTTASNRTSQRVVGELLAARIFAWAGQEDAAVALLERLATDLPGLPPADISLEPRYAVPLRDHAGFRALAARLDAQMATTRLE